MCGSPSCYFSYLVRWMRSSPLQEIGTSGPKFSEGQLGSAAGAADHPQSN